MSSEKKVHPLVLVLEHFLLEGKRLGFESSARQRRRAFPLEDSKMKVIVIGRSSGASLDALMAVYPRHKAVADAFIERGDVIGIGPFSDRSGNLAIFRSREAAEAFVAQDPFILEGLIGSYEIREWGDNLLA